MAGIYITIIALTIVAPLIINFCFLGYFYQHEKEEAMIPETRSFLGRIYDGSVGALMNTLIRQGNLSEKDLDELEEILHNARKKADTQEE